MGLTIAEHDILRELRRQESLERCIKLINVPIFCLCEDIERQDIVHLALQVNEPQLAYDPRDAE